jgi:acyl-coenzyme A thioesterase PaaI-like protein
VDIQTHFLRGVEANDVLTVEARVVTRGATMMHLSAEAFNAKGKLVATSTTNMMIQRHDSST